MRSLDTDTDIVIGSGAAGSTLAATLTGHHRVLLLERGGHFGRELFNQREWDRSRALYAGSGKRATEDGAIPVPRRFYLEENA